MNRLSNLKVVPIEEIRRYKKTKTGYTSDGRPAPHAAEAIPQEDLARLRDFFLNSNSTRYGLRNWTLVLMGVNVGLRCGDITSLRVGDIYRNGEIKTKVDYVQEKTSRWEVFYIQDSLKPDLLRYIKTLKDTSPSAWLFPNERGGRLTTKSAYAILKRANEKLGFDFHFSTHSLRKTLGKNAYRQFGMDGARELLRHRDNKVTARYIGVTEDEIEKRASQLRPLGV